MILNFEFKMQKDKNSYKTNKSKKNLPSGF